MKLVDESNIMWATCYDNIGVELISPIFCFFLVIIIFIILEAEAD